MPVDRSISGIRVSGRAEKRRRATRFPTQLSPRVNYRRSALRPDDDYWRDSDYFQDSQYSDAATGPPPPDDPYRDDSQPGSTTERHRHRAGHHVSEPSATWRPDVEHRPAHRTVLVGRVPAHSAKVARPADDSGENDPAGPVGRRPIRALVISLVVGAVVIVGAGVAAMAVGATQAPAPEISDADRVPATTTAVTGSTESLGALSETVIVPATPTPAAATGTPDPASTVPGPFVTTGQGANGGPATVSTLAPGDPGFGWPSSAFGVAP